MAEQNVEVKVDTKTFKDSLKLDEPTRDFVAEEIKKPLLEPGEELVPPTKSFDEVLSNIIAKSPQPIHVTMPDTPKGIYKAIPKIKYEMKDVKKKFLQALNYNALTSEAVFAGLQKVMGSNGVFITFKTIKKSTTAFETKNKARGLHWFVDFIFTLHASDGSSVDIGEVTGECKEFGDKGFSKCVTFAQKTVLTSVFLIGGGEADADGPPAPTDNRTQTRGPSASKDQKPPGSNQAGGNIENKATPWTMSAAQRKRLFAIATKNEWTDADVKTYIAASFAGITSTKDLTKDQYEQACKAFVKYDPPSKIEAAKTETKGDGGDDIDAALQ